MRKLIQEVKVITLHEMGVRLDDQREAAEREHFEFNGAKKAFSLGSSKVEELTAHIDKDVLAGVLDLDQCAIAKRWVLRAMGALQNLGVQAEVQGYQSHGKVMALTQAVAQTKEAHDKEKARLAEIVASEGALTAESDPSESRPAARAIGEHPGNDIAARRSELTAKVVPASKKAPKKAGKVAKKGTGY